MEREEAERLLRESMSQDPLGELYNVASAATLSGAGLTSLLAQLLRSGGYYDTESVIEGVPAQRPEMRDIPYTWENMMERVGADPEAPESLVGSFLDPATGTLAAAGAIGKAMDAKTLAQALRRGEIGQFPTTTPGRIKNVTNEHGGYTVDLMTGDVPKDGIMMGIYANDSGKTGVLPKGTPLTKNTIKEWVKTNAGPLSQVDNHLGTWKEAATESLYLDVAKRFAPDEIRKATKFGEKTGQKAGFNLGTFEETPVGNWREFIHSPEMQARMDEMAVIGREYMNQHATKEWWDTHGTLFEEIWPGHLDQVIGFVASTSPLTPPVQNLQVASEYMRRLLKGEAVIQPNWRAPEGLMKFKGGVNLKAGVKMPMEQQRAKNLNTAATGKYQDLSGPKVNDMASAMSGDSDAAVMDRWYTRIAEKPEAGVFTADKPEVFVNRKQYGELRDVVNEAAKNAARSGRNFSADVWVGMRETAKRTGRLFGQKMTPGAISGESKGLADLLADLIESKAKHLNISVKEMKSRLAKGDANLLSVILGTPLGAYLYQQLEAQGNADDADA